MDTKDLTPHLLVQTKHGELLQVSTVWPTYVTAQVLYPKLDRTTVREYTFKDVSTWKTASTTLVNKYEDAWGFNDPSHGSR